MWLCLTHIKVTELSFSVKVLQTLLCVLLITHHIDILGYVQHVLMLLPPKVQKIDKLSTVQKCALDATQV